MGSAAVYAEQLGTGDAAGAFRINNPANGDNAVYGETNGTASAINANQIGTGRGMIAQINNPGNTQSAFLAQTNGTGPAIVANQSNGGLALLLQSGGISVSTGTLDAIANTVIDIRATAYRIVNASSPFTFGGGITLNEGDLFYFINDDGTNNASIEGIVIPSNQGAILIYISGALRAIYGTTGS